MKRLVGKEGEGKRRGGERRGSSGRTGGRGRNEETEGENARIVWWRGKGRRRVRD